MAQLDRVLIDPENCQVSQPGFDVKTANLDQMAFDSRFAAIGQAVYGQVRLPNRNSNSFVAEKTTVLFGRTFPLPPMFLYGWIVGNAGAPDAKMHIPLIDGYNPSVFVRELEVDAKVLTNKVVFSNWYYSGSVVNTYWKALI